MDKMRFETPDMTEQNIDRIAALFPGCVTEMRGGVDGKVKRGINFEMLKQMLSPDVVDGDECYEFTWVGKRASIVEANKPIRKTLRPCPEESKDWDATENLYIEGDNLEVLKLLQEAYLGKVKMIYIDPPYNTGNDFIYADDFMRSQEEENEQMRMYDENENRLFKNTDTNGRFHSDWCSMMYSRLMLARNLLTDDGVIFISIDDNEIDNLSKLCSDVLGETNFICKFIWKSKLGKVGTTSTISTAHEYILCYSKNLADVSFKMIKKEYEGRKENLRQWGVADRREDRPSMYYPITINGVTVYPIKEDGTYGRWRVGEEMAKQLLKEGVLELSERNGKYNIYRTFPAGISYTPYETLLLDSIGTTAKGATMLNVLKLSKMFDFSKPIELVKHFAMLSTTENDIVMDFFSGSATTAHAVMQLNAEERQRLELSLENLDKSDPDYLSKFQALSSQLSQTGKRKFIMVQLPEPCDEQSEAYKAGYKNICEIGKERIRRAGKQILELSLKSFEKEGLIEKVSKSKISALSSKNSLGKEGVIEKYAGELSEIRSLEEVYGSGGARVSSHQAAAAGGDLRTGRPNASGGSFHSVEYSGGTVAGNAGVYPVFESGKGITGGVGNTVIALRSLAVLNELGYRVCLERFRGNQQNALLSDQISLQYLTNSDIASVLSDLEEISKMLSSLIKYLSSKL